MSWVRRLFNVTACSFEANRFDTPLMDNPDIEGEQYQHGTLYGYEIREYLPDKYGHTCQYCGGASKDSALEWEHIVPKSKGGSDKVSGATLSCHTCNQDKGSKSFFDWLAVESEAADGRGRKELAVARVTGIQKVMNGKTNGVSNRYCAWANSMRKAMEKEVLNIFGDVQCVSGGRAKYGRTSLGLPEEHHYDALCVGTIPQSGYRDRTHGYSLCAKCIGRGPRYHSKQDKSGVIVQKAPKGTNYKRQFGCQNGVLSGLWCRKANTGAHTGRVMTRSSGSFAIRTLQGRLAHARYEYCTWLQPDNGYQYAVRRAGPTILKAGEIPRKGKDALSER